MKVTVVVPTWRRPAELAKCLAGLAGQTRPPDEVLVVARSQDSETRALLDGVGTDPPVHAVEVQAPGVVASLNAGLAAASGELVAIVDDDAVPRPDWIERIERQLSTDGVGGVGGRDWVHQEGRVLDGQEPVVGKMRWFGRVVGNHHLGVGPPRDVDLLKGANMAFRKAALRDPAIDAGLRGSGTQVHWEIDLCLATKRAGWRLVYDPAIAVDHFPAPRFDEDQRQGRSLGALENEVYNETYLLLKHLPPWRGAVALAYGLLVGSRLAPGMLVALEQRVRGKRAGGRLAAAQRARWQVVRTLMP